MKSGDESKHLDSLRPFFGHLLEEAILVDLGWLPMQEELLHGEVLMGGSPLQLQSLYLQILSVLSPIEQARVFKHIYTYIKEVCCDVFFLPLLVSLAEPVSQEQLCNDSLPERSKTPNKYGAFLFLKCIYLVSLETTLRLGYSYWD